MKKIIVPLFVFLVLPLAAHANDYIFGDSSGAALGHLTIKTPLTGFVTRSEGMAKGKGWYLPANIVPLACTATERRISASYSNLGQPTGTITEQCQAKTAQELADEQTSADESVIASMATRKAMWVLVELISKLLAQGTIVANDFTPAVKAAYQELKAKVDVVKP